MLQLKDKCSPLSKVAWSSGKTHERNNNSSAIITKDPVPATYICTENLFFDKISRFFLLSMVFLLIAIKPKRRSTLPTQTDFQEAVLNRHSKFMLIPLGIWNQK